MPYKYNPPKGWSPDISRGEIVNEFSKWNQQAGSMVVSDYDLPMYRAGLKEAVVTFLLRGVKMTVRIDTWDTFNVNLRCAFLNIRDIRLAEARGALDSMRETFAALPAGPTKRDAYQILEIMPGSPLPVAEAMYKVKAQQLHPDKGGDAAAMAELNAAITELREAAK